MGIHEPHHLLVQEVVLSASTSDIIGPLVRRGDIDRGAEDRIQLLGRPSHDCSPSTTGSLSSATPQVIGAQRNPKNHAGSESASKSHARATAQCRLAVAGEMS